MGRSIINNNIGNFRKRLGKTVKSINDDIGINLSLNSEGSKGLSVRKKA